MYAYATSLSPKNLLYKVDFESQYILVNYPHFVKKKKKHNLK